MEQATLDEFEGEAAQETTGNNPIFYWTGHPFVDAGLSALLLLSGKKNPEEITEEDVENTIDIISELYSNPDWNSKYLHAMIFPNSGLLMVNPGIRGSISRPIKEAIKKEKTLKLSKKSKIKILEKVSKSFDEETAKMTIEEIEKLSDYYNVSPENVDDVAKKVSSFIIKKDFVNDAIKKKIKSSLKELYEETKNSIKGSENRCSICGRYASYEKINIYSSLFPLSGSGGILNYLENTNGNAWEGQCFLLDEREFSSP
jgi:hypothetical protein